MKNGLSKICGRQPLKNLLGPFLNTLTQIKLLRFLNILHVEVCQMNCVEKQHPAVSDVKQAVYDNQFCCFLLHYCIETKISAFNTFRHKQSMRELASLHILPFIALEKLNRKVITFIYLQISFTGKSYLFRNEVSSQGIAPYCLVDIFATAILSLFRLDSSS